MMTTVSVCQKPNCVSFIAFQSNVAVCPDDDNKNLAHDTE